ncbi:MAG: hypothetical protein RMJ44_10125 [Cytophagales bacterium]|nr:hypothetical protein [Bernardetiaceae bacterium]MDW8211433.1 hypothetical protein [Cytophagales bacterium]
MNTYLTHLPDTARLWLYPCERTFTAQEQQAIQRALKDFTSTWSSHGAKLVADADIIFGQIILLAVDTSILLPSGCSIDQSVDLMRKIENDFQIKLLDQGKIFYKTAQGLAVVPFHRVKQAIEQGIIHQETLILNTWAQTLGQLRQHLFLPASQCWLQRYFKPQTTGG